MDARERWIILKKLIPTPSKIDFRDGSDFILSDGCKIRLSFSGSRSEEKKAEKIILKAFSDFWKRTPNLSVNASKKGGCGQEGYKIDISKTLISVSADTVDGIRNAMKTLRQLAEPVRGLARTEDFFLVPCSIKDAPVLAFRGIHFCIFPETKMWDLEKKIRLAAYHKFNYAVIEAWGVFPFASHPELSWTGKTIDPKELKRLIRLGKELGITLCPQFNILGHASEARGCTAKHTVLDFAPELEVLFEPGGWTWCLSNPYTRQVLADAIAELLEFYENPPYFHIGCDESLDFATCRDCRRSNREKLLLDHLTFFNDLIRSRGARTVMWHDMLLVGGPEYSGYIAFGKEADGLASLWKKLPKDIIIADWQYGYPQKPGSKKEPLWPTNKFFHDHGFDVLVCPFLNPMGVRSQAKSAKERNLMGLLETTWHKSHSNPSIQTEFVTASDAAWNGGESRLDECKINGFASDYSIATHLHMRQICQDMGITEYEQTGFTDYQISPSYNCVDEFGS